MLTYENRCPVCGEDRLEHVHIQEEGIAHCLICGYWYQLVEDTEDWEELMGAKSA